MPSPYWVTYPEQVLLCGAEPVIVETYLEDDFLLNPAALKKAITPRTKGLILNTPSNPVGSAYDRAHLEGIAELAVKHNIYIISDEIYGEVVNGVSKSYAMTGWRIGYAAGPREIIEAMGNIQSQSTSNPASISQKAAVEALNGGYKDFIAMMVERFDRRRD